jgi:hypothetical protein
MAMRKFYPADTSSAMAKAGDREIKPGTNQNDGIHERGSLDMARQSGTGTK